MASADIEFTDEEYQILVARSGLIATQFDLFGTLSAGSPPDGFLTQDEHSSRAIAIKIAGPLRKFILECQKEVSYKETDSQRFFSTEAGWDTGFSGKASLISKWKDSTVPFLETVLALVDNFPSEVFAKPKVFFPDTWTTNSPWKDADNTPGYETGDNALQKSLPEFIEEVKRFLGVFGNSYFLRRRIAPPPGVTDVGANMPTDMSLQRKFVGDLDEKAWPINATHYVSSTQKDIQSQGNFLPIRLAPHDHATPLAAGWDDMNFMYLTSDNKLTNEPLGAAVDNGILIAPGTPVRVTEVVLGKSGIWVGFIFTDTKLTTMLYKEVLAGPDGHGRILYTRPEYLRKIHRETIQSGDIQIDPVLAYSLMPYDNESPRAKIPDGLKLIKPGDNLNWKKMGYGDVKLTYFNFSEYNKKNIPTQTEKLEISPENIIAYPRLRFSEGYYYFVAIDGKRKTVGDLLTEMAPDTNNASSALKEAKESEAIKMIANLREKALNTILEYTGKVVDVQTEKYLALKDLYTVNVAQAMHQGGAANMKVLFAIPAQIIDALPDNPNPYYDNIIPTSDFYTSFSSGRDYTFTIKISDVKKVSEGLVKVLTNIKDKLNSFTSEGGSIRNANNVKYNIESQIERIKAFPVLMEEFLIRQTNSHGNRDAITSHLVDGLKIEGEAFIQIGVRDNGKTGPDARQTVSFVLYSPDPKLLKRENRKELIALDPFITDKEYSGTMSRSGIVLKKALPWLRSKFLDAEGCRTLHYFMAHRNIIQFSDSLGRDLRMNEWMKFLQSYTVPPLMIKLSKERSQSPEEIDCKKLIEELLDSGTIIREEDKVLRELVENNCGEEYLKAVLKDTSAMDPEGNKKSIHLKQLFTKNLNAIGDAFGIELLTELYQNFLHKLDPQGLIALLMACLSHKLGVSFTAEALCEVAIEKLIESVGVEEMKKQLVEWIPELALFFPELQQIAVEQNLGMSTADMGIKAYGQQFFNSALEGEDFSEQFAEHFGDITNQDTFAKAPIAAAMTMSPPVHDYRVYSAIAQMERMGRNIPLVPTTNSMTNMGVFGESGAMTIEEIAMQKTFYLDKGFSSREADAALVRDGALEVLPSFVENVKNPQSVDIVGGIESGLNHLTHLDDKLSNLPPNPSDVDHYGNTYQNMADVASAAEQAKEFIKYLKQIINLQELCEKIVGPLLQAPGLLFSDPNDFVRNWENWADGLKDSLVRQFQFPDLNIPTLRMPDNLKTDDLIGAYAKMLLQVLAALIGMILGEILNFILLELLERCFEEEEGQEAKSLGAPSPTSTIPLPSIGQIAADLPAGVDAPDFAAWLRDITNFLSNDQLCSLLLGEATDNTVNMVLDRTQDLWPDIWSAGMDNGPDIQTVFMDLGNQMADSGGLEICNAIRATTPILVSACEADYDYDARCAELQLQGLTKEECDEVIRQEIEDLRNKIMGLSSMLFPDQNILQGALPEPCGENGYFMLPSAMKDTMSRVTDNILQAVKTSLIGDMSSLKFFSMPPRSLLAQSDPEELKKTYNIVMEAMEGKHEVDCVMPICHNPMEIFAEAMGSKDSWNEVIEFTPRSLAEKGFLPLVYSSRGHRLLVELGRGYTKRGMPIDTSKFFIFDKDNEINSPHESFQPIVDAMREYGIGYNKGGTIQLGKESYKALPDPTLTFEDRENKTPIEVDKPKSLYTIADLFVKSDIPRIEASYTPSVQLMGYIWDDKTQYPASPVYGEREMPDRFNRVFGYKRAFEISTLFYNFALNSPAAQDIIATGTYGYSTQDILGTPTEIVVDASQVHTMEIFTDVASLFASEVSIAVHGSDDPNEKKSPIGHRYALSAEEYSRARSLKCKSITEIKYTIPYKLDQPLSVLLPNFGYTSAMGTGLEKHNLNAITAQQSDNIESYVENGQNPSTAFISSTGYIAGNNIASSAFYEILASYLGVSSSSLNPALLHDFVGNTGPEDSHVHKLNKVREENKDRSETGVMDDWILGGANALQAGVTDSTIDAFFTILDYAPSNESSFAAAFFNMPIGEALGITKRNIRSLFPSWAGLYEAIEEGGVYFDLVPAEMAINTDITGMRFDRDNNNETAWNDFLEKVFFFGGKQVRPVAVGLKNYFRDSENAFENMSPEDIIPSLSKQPTSPKLIKAFDEPNFHPTFPKALYTPVLYRPASKKSRHTFLSAIDGMTKPGQNIPGTSEDAYNPSWTNINPDVMYFPMPFKNPLAAPRARAITEKLLGAMSNLGFDALGSGSVTIKDQIAVADLDNILLYQEYTTNPFHRAIKQQAMIKAKAMHGNPDYLPGAARKIQDDYKISKSKILPFAATKNNFNIGNDRLYDPTKPVAQTQIREPEFDFEFVEDFDEDVYALLESIGLKDTNDVAFYGEYLDRTLTVQGEDTLPAGKLARRVFPSNMKKVDQMNIRSMIFSKLMVSKLAKLSEEYAANPGLDDETSRILGFTFATNDYSACKFAYVNKIFGKLRLSRLNERKYMKKLWSKVLKTPINSAPSPQCKQLVDRLTTNTQDDLENTETDFFNIDSIKPQIMEFYKNSVCRDVYESSGDVYTASQRALIEAALILLVRVYCLEMCFAGMISWDAYNLGDVFKEPIIKKILIKNMKMEINNFDLIIDFANDYMKKQENIKSSAARVVVKNFSGLEYVIEQESENINNTISSIFNNSKPISTKLTLNTVSSKDSALKKGIRDVRKNGYALRALSYENLEDKAAQMTADINGAARDRDVVDYPALNFLTDNIYTHNYSDGLLGNRYLFNPAFFPGAGSLVDTQYGKHISKPDQNSIIGQASQGQSPAQNFAGFSNEITQRNFLHSVPLNYDHDKVVTTLMAGELLTDASACTRVLSNSDGEITSTPYAGFVSSSAHGTSGPDAFYDYLRHYIDVYGTERPLSEDWVIDAPGGEDTSFSVLNSILSIEEKIKRILSSKLLSDPCQMVNQHEYLAGNLINSRLGNFIIQPYVKIADQTDRSGFKSRSSLGDSVEPCDINDETQGSIAEALTELGEGPILSNTRSENNPFKAWIYGIVPLSVFSWFMSDSFVPWINKEGNEKIKLLYNDHGIKPFFEELKFGMRLVYVSQFGPLHMTDTVQQAGNSYPPDIERDLRDVFGLDGLKKAKAGLVSRTYFLEDPALNPDKVKIGPAYWKMLDAGWSFKRKYGKLGQASAPTPEADAIVNRVSLLFNELHIPVVEIEKDIDITAGMVNVNGKERLFDDFCYTKKVSFFQGDVFGSDVDSAYTTARDFSVKDFFQPENKERYKALTQTPSNFYFKHVASDLLEELQTSPEFKLLFGHLLPIRRYMALGFLYSSDALLDFIGEPTDVLDGTKATILNIIQNILESSEDYTFIPEAVKNQMANDIAANLRGTNMKEPNLTKKILEIIWKCLLMILKGFVELTDPAIIIAKTILDVAKLVYDTIIIGIEMGLQVTKQILQQTIDQARASMMQLEVNLAIAGPSAKMSLDTLRTAADKAVDGGVPQTKADFATDGPAIKVWNLEGDNVSNWDVDITLGYSPDDTLVAPWDTFKTAASAIQESLAAFTAASDALNEAQAEMDGSIKEFEEEFEDVKKEMDDIFGSNWLLPATWAALIPSMTPYLGGIVPPPFFVGPPSTIPGMIYLALLLADAYEEEEASALEDSKDPNCEDEL